MKKVIFVLSILVGLSFTGTAQAQGPPDACGPKAQLPAEFNQNVGADARCFELRMYTADPDRGGDINTLHQRFREEEVAIFEKHGAEVVAVWQRLDAGLLRDPQHVALLRQLDAVVHGHRLHLLGHPS